MDYKAGNPQSRSQNQDTLRLPGVYVLLFSIPEDLAIEVGRHGITNFPVGAYA